MQGHAGPTQTRDLLARLFIYLILKCFPLFSKTNRQPALLSISIFNMVGLTFSPHNLPEYEAPSIATFLRSNRLRCGRRRRGANKCMVRNKSEKLVTELVERTRRVLPKQLRYSNCSPYRRTIERMNHKASAKLPVPLLKQAHKHRVKNGIT